MAALPTPRIEIRRRNECFWSVVLVRDKWSGEVDDGDYSEEDAQHEACVWASETGCPLYIDGFLQEAPKLAAKLPLPRVEVIDQDCWFDLNVIDAKGHCITGSAGRLGREEALAKARKWCALYGFPLVVGGSVVSSCHQERLERP